MRYAKRTYRQRKFAKLLLQHPVVIAKSSPDCSVSNPFRADRVEDLLVADEGFAGGFCDGSLPETNRRKF